nr:helix-turn-helix domain-containing protein [Halalkalicoccus paucihalophilus]
MYYVYTDRLKPPNAHRRELGRHHDICRQVYNHFLYRLRSRTGTIPRPYPHFNLSYRTSRRSGRTQPLLGDAPTNL